MSWQSAGGTHFGHRRHFWYFTTMILSRASVKCGPTPIVKIAERFQNLAGTGIDEGLIREKIWPYTMKITLTLCCLALVCTGCRDALTEAKLRTLELQVKNLETDLSLIKKDIAFIEEMDAEDMKTTESMLNTIGKHSLAIQALGASVSGQQEWIDGVSARAQRR